MTFHSTRWSMVARAGRGDGGDVRDAIAWLFEAYSYPLYAYARRRALSHEEAEDAVHELFAHCLEHGSLANADPARGRFRSYILGAFDNLLSNRRRFWNALKRGGGRSSISLDAHDAEKRYACEPAGGVDPRKVYEAAWARTVIDRAFARVRADYAARGEGLLFERLRSRLVEEGDPGLLADLARELGRTEDALKVALHRLRKRFRTALEGEIAETVGGPAEVEDELRHLFDALGG